jgi:hypothetical protein
MTETPLLDRLVDKAARAIAPLATHPEDVQYARSAAERALVAVLPDLLDEAREGAWEQGYDTGYLDGTYFRDGDDSAVNPYRRADE